MLSAAPGHVCVRMCTPMHCASQIDSCSGIAFDILDSKEIFILEIFWNL